MVGDSISAGYGTLGTLNDTDCFPTESHWDTYEAIAARAVGAEVSTIAASGHGMYRNYGGDMTDTLPQIYARTLMNETAPAWELRASSRRRWSSTSAPTTSATARAIRGCRSATPTAASCETVRAKYPNALIICFDRSAAERHAI